MIHPVEQKDLFIGMVSNEDNRVSMCLFKNVTTALLHE